jgi:hypothetical protein
LLGALRETLAQRVEDPNHRQHFFRTTIVVIIIIMSHPHQKIAASNLAPRMNFALRCCRGTTSAPTFPLVTVLRRVQSSLDTACATGEFSLHCVYENSGTCTLAALQLMRLSASGTNTAPTIVSHALSGCAEHRAAWKVR